ncbi:MAG: hypothetical protein Q8R08_04130 [bacterium]|nr:hypothetical protein [bacterium]
MSNFFSWFFMKAPSHILEHGKNFMRWAWQFFSIGFFVPRLFSPWHRDITGYGRGFDLGRFMKVFSWNLISRFIGAVMRILVMIFGVLVEIFIFSVTVAAFASWVLIPLLIPFLLVVGILSLFV